MIAFARKLRRIPVKAFLDKQLLGNDIAVSAIPIQLVAMDSKFE
jgi:hypothetical protein